MLLFFRVVTFMSVENDIRKMSRKNWMRWLVYFYTVHVLVSLILIVYWMLYRSHVCCCSIIFCWLLICVSSLPQLICFVQLCFVIHLHLSSFVPPVHMSHFFWCFLVNLLFLCSYIPLCYYFVKLLLQSVLLSF